MASFEKFLADSNFKVLYKTASGDYKIEVVDENFTPTVVVAGKGENSRFPLEKLGVFYSDGDNKFYSEDDNSDISYGELTDRAVEAHLFANASAQKKIAETHLCEECGGPSESGLCSGCQDESTEGHMCTECEKPTQFAGLCNKCLADSSEMPDHTPISPADRVEKNDEPGAWRGLPGTFEGPGK